MRDDAVAVAVFVLDALSGSAAALQGGWGPQSRAGGDPDHHVLPYDSSWIHADMMSFIEGGVGNEQFHYSAAITDMTTSSILICCIEGITSAPSCHSAFLVPA